MIRFILALVLLTQVFALRAQELVNIHGRVLSSTADRSFYGLMIVNRRTRTGTFGDADGSFTVKALQSDTLMVACAGHYATALTMRDSVPRANYVVMIRLVPVVKQLPEVEIFSERTLQEIQKEISKLGYREQDYRLSTVNALQSPITFLYQEFSQRERSKRLAAQLRNEDKKRELLRELLRKYVEYDIINLSDESFDDFIDFCAVPDGVIKGLSQYDFLMYVKSKYDLYTSLGPTRRH
ncbi:MAG TPA: hypothetical protein PK760_03570 [Flavobacteriales bacterium]|nr:hypothetical protein [Flavobacteriales bacterium]